MPQVDFTGDDPARDSALTDDALMYAITGEPVPAAVAGRPAFAEEAAHAEATVASLRRGLHALGAELAQAPPDTPHAVSASRRSSRFATGPRSWSRPWLVVAAAGVVGVALAGGIALNNRTDGSEPSDSRSLPGVVACAETIAVGKVTATSQQGDRLVVTLATERYLKPDNGPAVLSISDPVPAAGAAGPGWSVGDRVLVVVHDAASGTIDHFAGLDIDTEWAWMERALPASRSIDPKQCRGE